MNTTDFENIIFLHICNKPLLIDKVDEDYFKNPFVQKLFALVKSYHKQFSSLPFSLNNPNVDQIKEIAAMDPPKYITNPDMNTQDNLDMFVKGASNIISSDFQRYQPDWLESIVENTWIPWEASEKGMRMSIQYRRSQKITPANVEEVIKKCQSIMDLYAYQGSDNSESLEFTDAKAHRPTQITDLVNSGYGKLNLWISGSENGGFEPGTLSILLAPPNTGKCCHYDTRIRIRNKNTNKVEKIKIGEFYSRQPLVFHQPSDDKFIDTAAIDIYEVWTDTGWSDIKAIGRTKKFVEYEVSLEGNRIICADTHILFDENFNEIYAKDLKDKMIIQTELGPKEVTSILNNGKSSNMYDLQLDDENHRYYTNGILSHNSIWLANIARGMMMNGYNVLLVSLEMAVNKIYARIGSSTFGVSMDQYREFASDEAKVQQKIDEFLKTQENDFFRTDENGKFRPRGILRAKKFTEIDAKGISLFAREEEKRLGIKYHAIVLDYMTELQNSYGTRRTDMYNFHKENTNDMFNDAGKYNKVWITAHQTNPDSFGADDLTMSSSGESRAILHRPDFVFGMIQTPGMKSNNIYHVKAIKTREGAYKNYRILMDINYDRMFLSEKEMMAPDQVIF
jgi:hypothetical protein